MGTKKKKPTPTKYRRRVRWTHQRITKTAHAAIGHLATFFRVPRATVVESLSLLAEQLMAKNPEWYIIFIGDKPASIALGSDAEALETVTRQQMLGQKIDGKIEARLADKVPFEQFVRISALATFQLLSTMMMAQAGGKQQVRLT